MSRVDHSSIDGDEAKSNDAEEAMGFVAAEKRTEWFSRGLCPHKDISAVTDWINQITNETAKNWLSHVTLALTQTIAAYKKKHPLMTEFGVTNAFASGKTSLATKRSVVAKTPKRPKPTQEKRQIELQAGSAASTDTDETKESTSTPTPENPRPKNPRDVTYAFDDDLALTYIAAIRCLYFLKAQEKALVSSSHTFNSSLAIKALQCLLLCSNTKSLTINGEAKATRHRILLQYRDPTNTTGVTSWGLLKRTFYTIYNRNNPSTTVTDYEKTLDSLYNKPLVGMNTYK